MFHVERRPEQNVCSTWNMALMRNSEHHSHNKNPDGIKRSLSGAHTRKILLYFALYYIFIGIIIGLYEYP